MHTPTISRLYIQVECSVYEMRHTNKLALHYSISFWLLYNTYLYISIHTSVFTTHQWFAFLLMDASASTCLFMSSTTVHSQKHRQQVAGRFRGQFLVGRTDLHVIPVTARGFSHTSNVFSTLHSHTQAHSQTFTWVIYIFFFLHESNVLEESVESLKNLYVFGLNTYNP